MQAKDVVLGLLMQGPKSGYDIKQEYEVSLNHFFDASYGSVYPTLKQLEKSDCIIKEIIVQEGKPNKNIYSITESGKKHFMDYMNSPVQDDIYRSDILARLFFSKYMDDERLVSHLEEAVELRKKYLSQLEDVYENLKHQLSKPRMITLQFGIKDYRAQVEVLEQSISYMKSDDHPADYWD
ncbi:PadR family transcriptional regulator [Paenibacillus marinisediminis]